ncbi:hypothetical protein [Roseateles toxinivorans]|uniref:DUF2059 domain-containing protein n=1 Tax=Roseateles toxinivorans TaxID=270368 RepID=A0A4R6QS66_9BURK|nr:hypothetical protein [Roseateles toxinivorans]TDP74364.1 hypothetical protein DES47_101421 [Roseateles toxinivorans]
MRHLLIGLLSAALLLPATQAATVAAAASPRAGATAQALAQVLLDGFQQSGRTAATHGVIKQDALPCIAALDATRFERTLQAIVTQTLTAAEREHADRVFARPAAAGELPRLIARFQGRPEPRAVAVTLDTQDREALTQLQGQGTLDKLLRSLLEDPAAREALVAESKALMQQCGLQP